MGWSFRVMGQELKKCGAKISPTFNKLVIFNTRFFLSWTS